MIRILALDPGKTTGYCYGMVEGDTLFLGPGEKALGYGDLVGMIEDFIGLLDMEILSNTHIIYEDFTHRQGATGVDYTPVKLQGVIELQAERYFGYVNFYKQNPAAQADRNYYSNERLKQLGVYWPHGKGHARSATKHLLYWLNFGAGGQYVDVNRVKMELKA